jgi:UDP-2,3-diacylglucosamine hydrolase
VPGVCFISDLHLSDSRPAVTAGLRHFLAGHAGLERLYILGDLFEAWPGDDDDSALALAVTGMLRDFRANGPELLLMTGNRDFLLGERFCRRTGATLLTDPAVIDLYGTPTLLMHGDSLCTADTAYQSFRATCRTPAWRAEVLARPLAERRALAKELRARSREATSMKSEDILDVTPAEVRRVMTGHGVRQLIHGHTHRPARHEEETGLRWVLGAWEESAWILQASDADINLINIDISKS